MIILSFISLGLASLSVAFTCMYIKRYRRIVEDYRIVYQKLMEVVESTFRQPGRYEIVKGLKAYAVYGVYNGCHRCKIKEFPFTDVDSSISAMKDSLNLFNILNKNRV